MERLAAGFVLSAYSLWEEKKGVFVLNYAALV